MRILFLHNYPQHYRQEIFKLIETNFDVEWIFGDKMSNVASFDTNELKSSQIKPFTNLPLGLKWQNLTSTLFKKYDVVIMLGDFKNLAYWIQLLFRRNVIVWTHGYYQKDGFLLRLVKNSFHSLCSHVLFYGNNAKLLAPSNVQRKSTVIFNSLPHISSACKRDSTKNRNGIMFIGRLNPGRNLGLMISAFREFQKQDPTLELHIVGDGPEKAKWENQLPRIKWHGAKYSVEDLRTIADQSFCGIFLGPIGLSVLHYAHFSLPVVAFRPISYHMPEAEILKEGINFSPFESFDTESIIKALKTAMLLDNDLVHSFNDKEIRERFNALRQLDIISNVIAQD